MIVTGACFISQSHVEQESKRLERDIDEVCKQIKSLNEKLKHG